MLDAFGIYVCVIFALFLHTRECFTLFAHFYVSCRVLTFHFALSPFYNVLAGCSPKTVCSAPLWELAKQEREVRGLFSFSSFFCIFVPIGLQTKEMAKGMPPLLDIETLKRGGVPGVVELFAF
jgi:hypothetical protein